MKYLAVKMCIWHEGWNQPVMKMCTHYIGRNQLVIGGVHVIQAGTTLLRREGEGVDCIQAGPSLYWQWATRPSHCLVLTAYGRVHLTFGAALSRVGCQDGNS